MRPAEAIEAPVSPNTALLLSGGAKFGFGLIQQRTDGTIQVDMVDYGPGKADGNFRFALHADGSPAQ